jgi:hypothetical protein
MKSSPIYNKLQHYLIEHACLWIFLTLICVDWRRTENEERNEREREREFGGDGVCGCSFGEHLNKKPFRPLYIFKVCVVVHLVNT